MWKSWTRLAVGSALFALAWSVGSNGALAARHSEFDWQQSANGKPGRHIFRVSAQDLNLFSKSVSFEVRLEPFTPKPGLQLFSLTTQSGMPLFHLGVKEVEKQQVLAFSLHLDARPEPLVIGVPISILQTSKEHKLILRYMGYRADLFVDGVLLDEEWPMGGFGPASPLTLETNDAVSEIGSWNRVITDAEIASRNGGQATIKARADSLLGPQSPQVQYWSPRGYNTHAGDAMPFYHDGVFHVFYLIDRRHHHSKWGLGAHQWGHISSRDLVHWTHEDPALTITNEWEASICTGSVFFHGGQFYAFYATRMPDRTERLGMAVSDDGKHFTKLAPTPFSEPEPPYKIGPNRDPFVYQQGDAFGMLVTAELAQPELFHRGGALERLSSEDLKHWSVSPKPFLVPGYNTSQPECSNLFSWRGGSYLLFGQDGLTHYRVSRGPDGPWTKPSLDVLDDPEAHVMKTAEFGSDRRIGVGFVAKEQFGGILVFRELIPMQDGTLGTRFIPEMLPSPGAELSWQATSLTGNGKIEKNRISIHAGSGMGVVAIERVPRNMRMTATFHGTGTGEFGVVARGEGNFENGRELRLQPSLRRVEWRSVNANSLAENPFSSIEQVEDLDRAVTLDVIVKDDVFDACINGVRTVIDREPGLTGDRFFLFVQNGELTVTDLRLRPLTGN